MGKDTLINGEMGFFALKSGEKFARRIIQEIGRILNGHPKSRPLTLSAGEEIIFANKEVKYIINESIRGKDIYIIQLMDDPYSAHSVNDNLVSLCAAINAARYSDARRITAVIPQFPYARQDKIRGREPLTAKVICNLMEASGVDKIITLDIHSEPIEGYFNHAKMENLHAGRILLKYIRKNINLDNLIVVAPDVGSSMRGRFFSKQLRLEFAIIDKARNYSMPSDVSSMRLVGNVRDRNVFINDDMIATGGTILNACKLLKAEGAKAIYISVSLPYFSNQAYKEFDKAHREGYFKQVIGTDAVFWGDDFRKNYPWYIEMSMAPLFAEVIFSLNQNRSVSRLLE